MHNAPKSVRYVRHGVRHGVRHQTRAVTGLCGMCGINALAHVRRITNQTRARFPSRARKHAAHTAHTAHLNAHAGLRLVAYRTPCRTYTAHPLIPPFLLKRKEVEEESRAQSAKEAATPAIDPVRCDEGNVAQFNARLRAECPEAFELAKALHQAGLIEGLKGARIGPPGSLSGGGVAPYTTDAAEGRIADIHWQRKGGRK